MLQEIKLRRLGVSDADRLTEMYKSVEITEENYRDILSDTDISFSKNGGMFLVNDYNKNMELLSDDNEVIIGAEIDGKIEGMIWYGKKWSYPYEDISLFDDCAEFCSVLGNSLKSNKLFPGKEIIVMSGGKGKLAHILFKALLEEGRNNGYEYMSGEVYRADGYEDESGYHICDMLNIPSFKTLKGTGGIHIGTAPQKKISKGKVTYYITPQVFLWKIDEAINKLAEFI